MDMEQKRLHVPLVDRTSVEPPPIIVAVVGPAQVSFSFSFFLFPSVLFFCSSRPLFFVVVINGMVVY
jgi:hypothetical protein